jgi:hypothetical protein
VRFSSLALSLWWFSPPSSPPFGLSFAATHATTRPRSLRPQVISDIVQTAMAFIDKLPSRDDKIELITTLRTVTEGRVRNQHTHLPRGTSPTPSHHTWAAPVKKAGRN